MYSFLIYYKVDALPWVCKHAEQHSMDCALVTQLRSNGTNQVLKL